MRAACEYLAKADLEGNVLLAGLASAAGVFYNFSGQNLDCFDWSAGPNEASEEDTDFWGYQWCATTSGVFSNASKHFWMCLHWSAGKSVDSTEDITYGFASSCSGVLIIILLGFQR